MHSVCFETVGEDITYSVVQGLILRKMKSLCRHLASLPYLGQGVLGISSSLVDVFLEAGGQVSHVLQGLWHEVDHLGDNMKKKVVMICH